MLRHFLYLDTSALTQYVSALEGGTVTGTTTRSSQSGSGSGGVDAKLLSASGSKTHEKEESRTIIDSHEARFDRLLGIAETSSEALGWVEVLQPNLDFAGIGIGATVSWECDLFIPQIVQTLTESDQLIELMHTFQPMASELGLNLDDMPSEQSMSMLSQFAKQAKVSPLIVGDDETTEWQIAGKLIKDFLHGEVEGRARIVGKVSERIQKGRWKPYVTFPGMNLLSREERRKREREGPKQGEENQFLAGPALMLDVLAIYR